MAKNMLKFNRVFYFFDKSVSERAKRAPTAPPAGKGASLEALLEEKKMGLLA